jgi:pimeloyl-ACP methyl ester carboxylesterase
MKLALTAVALLISTSVQADLKNFYYQRMLDRQARSGLAAGLELFRFSLPGDTSQLPTADPTQELTFDQLINPQDPKDTRTFKQRYYLNSAYAAGPDSPVFFYICGEATCTPHELSGAIQGYAQKYKGYLVALEHRYYGKSQPFPTLDPANLIYLSTENAIADLANFQKWATVQHQLQGKWLTVGGSYPGSLSAYYRLRHPELTQGSLASSGPVQARANFEEYDATVSRVAGQACADAMRGVVKKVEATLNDPTALAAMKKIFQADDVKDSIDFLYVIADMGAIAVQYGFRDQFCNAILQATDPVQGYATVGLKLFQLFDLTPVLDSFQGAESVNPDDYLNAWGMRGWMWQSCNEYGYWQVAYHDPAVSVRSSLIDQAYHNSVCTRLFGLQQPVDTSRVNTALYQPLLDPGTSRILFTNGSTDPWATLSITHANGNDTNPNTQVLLIDGGSHCSDLGGLAATGPVADAQNSYETLLESWLK